MQKFKKLIIIFFLCLSSKAISQSVEVSGKIESPIDNENIHVINKTAKLFTITNFKGEFNMVVKLRDTLVFTSIQHVTKEVVISKDIISTKSILVLLEENINNLDEVIVGKVLTGNLNSDVGNVKGDPPPNFVDLGLPGYTGKIATQSERRLSEASDFNPSAGTSNLGAGGAVSILPIINAITGRTKMLKERVKHEENENLLRQIKSRLSEVFFANNQLDIDLRTDFFYFCEEDPNFEKRCKYKSDIEIIEYLKEKLFQYKSNLKADTN